MKPDIPCNCDANDGLMRSDSGVLTNSDHLPVTSLQFVIDETNKHKNSLAQLSLGNLVCTRQGKWL